MSEPKFDEILRAWALEYDDRIPYKSKERRKAFIVLLGNLKDYGFDKEDINSSRKERIIRICVNPNYGDKKRLKLWIDIVTNDLEAAFLVYYGTIKIRKDVITAEMEAKLDNIEIKAAETKTLKKSFTQKNNDHLESENFDNEENTKEILENQNLEISEEMLSEFEDPIITWDEDFYKRFGLDDNDKS